MTKLVLHVRTAWDDFFPATNPTNINAQTFSSRRSYTGAYIYVSNCLFISITSASLGGALHCTSATYFLVETCSFFTCRTSAGNGGAIYLVNTNDGQTVLHKVCGYDCCTTYSSSSNSYGQFSYIDVYNVASSKNCVNYSSITSCVNQNSNSNHILSNKYGNICFLSVNVSLNKCYGRSAIYCYPFSDLNSVTCSLTYSTFASNIALGHTCINLWMSDAKFEIKSCNILRNTQVSDTSDGIIHTCGNLAIENSCILENTATYIFYQSSSSYTITLTNCTVDTTTHNQNLIIQSTVTKSFILALNHFSTQNCHAGYDSVGNLTPPNKQIICFTHGKCLYQPRLGDFFSLTNVFIFNFIYPCASSYL
jgi:hypothetical protein